MTNVIESLSVIASLRAYGLRGVPLAAEWCSSFLHECPCGFYGDPYRACTCSPGLVSRYQKRISGPFLDRVDIFVEVPHIDYEKLADDRLGEKSDKVRARVKAARSIQQKRFNEQKLTCNAEMAPPQVREFCRAEESAQSLVKAAMKQLYLSARATTAS